MCKLAIYKGKTLPVLRCSTDPVVMKANRRGYNKPPQDDNAAIYAARMFGITLK